MIVVAMQIIILAMGAFMAPVAIMMITLPIFTPSIVALGFDPVWFGVITLLNLEIGQVSPPFGMGLFVMKGVVSVDTTMADIYRAVLPFIGCDLFAILLIIGFPSIALWLPRLMS